MPRARDLGVVIGTLPTGPTNSVLDVPGVGLGHTTLHRDEAAPPEGRGTARTGVTVLVVAEDAFARPVPAGGAVLNGAGECTGFLTAQEWGSAETPVFLTPTMQLGRVYDSACRIVLDQHPEAADDVVIPVVAECDDSFLNDARRMQVEHDDVVGAFRAALDSRGSHQPPAEGAVGSGTGMSCFDFKGGIGTASRRVGDHTVGVLVMTNFGVREECVVAGVPVGRLVDRDGSGPNARPGRASASWSPTPRSALAPPADAWPPRSASVSPGPDRWRTTGLARSSSRSARACGSTARADPTEPTCSAARTSTPCSPPWWRRARRRSSTRCSWPSARSVAAEHQRLVALPAVLAALGLR